MNAYNTPFKMAEIIPPEFPDQKFYINDFTLSDIVPENDSKLIQRAVDKCAETGGGTVVVSEGHWKSGPIHLSSNINLHIEKNAEISFSEKYSDYLPVVFTRWEGMECYNYSPLIYANDCENVAVTGSGTLIGNGKAWWHWKELQQPAATSLCYAEADGIPVKNRVYGTEEAALRPSFIQFINCRNIQLKDFRIEDGPQWTLHPVYCENVLIQGVTVDTDGHNTDGLNPDSCKNVLIENCAFSTGDDCIAINSGMNEDGWRVAKPCENIVIRNCSMTHGHGGVVIGSGMSGGVKNVYISNCEISGTMQGVRMKSMRGRGGYVENIWVEQITVNNLSNEAIQVSMFYPYSTVPPRSETPSVFKNIKISGISGTGADIAVQILGLPDSPIENIELNNINISAEKSIICSDIKNIKINNCQLI